MMKLTEMAMDTRSAQVIAQRAIQESSLALKRDVVMALIKTVMAHLTRALCARCEAPVYKELVAYCAEGVMSAALMSAASKASVSPLASRSLAERG